MNERKERTDLNNIKPTTLQFWTFKIYFFPFSLPFAKVETWSRKALFCSSIHSSLYLDKLGYKYLAHLSLMTIYLCLCLWYHNKYATELRVLVYFVLWSPVVWFLILRHDIQHRGVLISLSTKWGTLSRIM